MSGPAAAETKQGLLRRVGGLYPALRKATLPPELQSRTDDGPPPLRASERLPRGRRRAAAGRHHFLSARGGDPAMDGRAARLRPGASWHQLRATRAARVTR